MLRLLDGATEWLVARGRTDQWGTEPHSTNPRRIEQINGFDMASPEKALEAYARLRTATSLTVALNRRGKPLTINFNIK